MNEVFRVPRERRRPRARAKRLLWRASHAVALGGLYGGRIREQWLRVERRAMPLPRLGAGWAGATLVHISDLHASPIVRSRYLHQCIERVNGLRPDFVAVTGDFITGPRTYARRVADVLAELSPRVATVACLGNHDYGILTPRGLGSNRSLADYTAERIARADVFVMQNETRTFRRRGAALQFVGLEDYWSGRFDLERAFDTLRPGVPTIALCHNPDVAVRVAARGADWVLAGHTHGAGPQELYRLHDRLWRTREAFFTAGEYVLPSGARLYVNRGLSYGRRVLLNARPEITVFTLVPAGRPPGNGEAG